MKGKSSTGPIPLSLAALVAVALAIAKTISIYEALGVILSVGLVGFLTNSFKEFEHRRGYWPLIGLFILVHCGAMYLLLTGSTKAFFLKSLLLLGIELFGMAFVIELVFESDDGA